jgi:hypothetical protein
MKRLYKNWLRGIILFAALGMMFCAYKEWPAPRPNPTVIFTRQAYDQIQEGMTEARVCRIIGAEPGDYTSAGKEWPTELEHGDVSILAHTYVDHSNDDPYLELFKHTSKRLAFWESDAGNICVLFDGAAVRDKAYFRRVSPPKAMWENLRDRVNELLHW